MTKKILVIGRGFVGQSIYNEILKKNFNISLVGSRNINALPNDYDYVIYASGNSSPRKSSTEPVSCLESNCFSLLQAVIKFENAHWILISSISVYETLKLNNCREDNEVILSCKNSIYSAHKILNEFYVKKYIKKYCIMRLSYMYGEFSKKNIFFDLRSNSKNIYLNQISKIRPLNIKHISNAVYKTIKVEKVGIFNIANKNVIEIKELISMKNVSYEFKNERYVDESNICIEKFVKEYGFNETKEELLEDIKKYIN